VTREFCAQRDDERLRNAVIDPAAEQNAIDGARPSWLFGGA
jgi:hypothetical protein